MKVIFKKKKGQILIFFIVFVVVLIMFSIIIIESGEFFYKKIHTQNISDSSALEGGLWYARSMNIISLSNKILVCSAIVSAIGVLLKIPKSVKLTELVIKIQDFVVGEGDFKKFKLKPLPVLVFLSVERNGLKNGVINIPVFNTENFYKEGLNPSFNVKRQYLFSGKNKIEKFYYIDHTTGEKRYIDKKFVKYNRKAMRWQTTKKINGRKLFVAREVFYKNKMSDKLVKIPLALEETGEHSILVATINNKINPLFNSKIVTNNKDLKYPPALISTSFVRIKGGSLSIWDINGANYYPEIEHIIFPKISNSKLKKLLKGADKIMSFIGENIILH